MYRSRILICVSIGILLGIYSAKFFPINFMTLSATICVLLLIFTRMPRVLILLFIFAGIVVGQYRSAPLISGYDLLDSYKNQKISLTAHVQNDPVYHETGQYQFYADQLIIRGTSIEATLRVRSYANDLRRGDTVQLAGTLRDGFAFWQGSMYFAETNVLTRDASPLQQYRARSIANIYSTLPDPEASLGLGFLIGVRSLLPPDLVDQLSITGLTHIVAVSGYNLTVLASVSRRFFARYSRFLALIVTMLLLVSFVSLTGLSPSILRALIVSGILIGAWYYGRKTNPWYILLYSSSFSALINPAFAWFDIGWYLSLSAFFGVLIVAPLLKQKFFRSKKTSIFSDIALETTSAQLLTLPIIMLVFGKVSIVALLANLFVLPLIPITMLLTFLLSTSVMMAPFLSPFLGLLTYIALRFVTNLIRFFSSFDWALLAMEISTFHLILLYICIFLVLVVMKRSLAGQSVIIESNNNGDSVWQAIQNGQRLNDRKPVTMQSAEQNLQN